jgi:uncharacterized membrane protein
MNGTPSFAFTTIDDPNVPPGNTIVYGLNNKGQFVGVYSVATGGEQAFIDNNGHFKNFDDPAAMPGTTVPRGINDLGWIVGNFTTPSKLGESFLDINGHFTTLNAPGTAPGNTLAVGVNDAGEVVGTFTDAKGNHGFVESHGVYTVLNDPLALPGSTFALGIDNNADVVGQYMDAKGMHDFVERHGVYTTVVLPGVPTGINDFGTIVGHSFDSAHGFIIPYHGAAVTIDDPSAGSGPFGGPQTVTFAINDKGQFVGYFTDSAGIHGYVATPLASHTLF